MPTSGDTIVTYSDNSSVVRVDVTYADGTVKQGGGLWLASDEIVTASDLLWNPTQGAAVSVSVDPKLDAPHLVFPALSADHWRYFQIANVTPANAQGDFALLHVPGSATVPSGGVNQFGVYGMVVQPTDPDRAYLFYHGGFTAAGYPASAGGDEMSAQILSPTRDASTWNYDVTGPALEAGYDGGPILYVMPNQRGIGQGEMAGIVTANGTLAANSIPMRTLINGWIAADHAASTQPTGAIVEQVPALLHQITADTGAAGINPAEASLVDMFSYENNNPDVAASGMDPAQHFAAYGWHENRAPDPLFDVNYYLSHNPDVAASGMDPLLHYATYGWKEGRDPSASFSTKTYLAANHDVQLAGIDPLQHYLMYGVNEQRTGTPAG